MANNVKIWSFLILIWGWEKVGCCRQQDESYPTENLNYQTKSEKPIGKAAIPKFVSYKTCKDIIHVKNMGTSPLYTQTTCKLISAISFVVNFPLSTNLTHTPSLSCLSPSLHIDNLLVYYLYNAPTHNLTLMQNLTHAPSPFFPFSLPIPQTSMLQ